MCTPVFVEFRRMCVTVTSDSSQLCRLLRNPLNARPRWTRSSFLYHQPPPLPHITWFLHIVASSVYETFLNSCTFTLTMWFHVCLKHLRLFASLTELFFMQFTLKVISKLNIQTLFRGSVFFTKCLFCFLLAFIVLKVNHVLFAFPSTFIVKSFASLDLSAIS